MKSSSLWEHFTATLKCLRAVRVSRFRFFGLLASCFYKLQLVLSSFNPPPLSVWVPVLFPARLCSQRSGFVLWLIAAPRVSYMFLIYPQFLLYSLVSFVYFSFACRFVACFLSPAVLFLAILNFVFPDFGHQLIKMFYPFAHLLLCVLRLGRFFCLRLHAREV